MLLKPSLAAVLDSAGCQELQTFPLHVVQFWLGEDVVVEIQDGVLAYHLQPAVELGVSDGWMDGWVAT